MSIVSVLAPTNNKETRGFLLESRNGVSNVTLIHECFTSLNGFNFYSEATIRFVKENPPTLALISKCLPDELFANLAENIL